MRDVAAITMASSPTAITMSRRLAVRAAAAAAADPPVESLMMLTLPLP
jgi:hypothetical protein